VGVQLVLLCVTSGSCIWRIITSKMMLGFVVIFSFNWLENFYIHRETVANNQLNEKMTKNPTSSLTWLYVIHSPPTSHKTKLTGLPPRPSHTTHGSTHPTPATTISRSIRRWINIPQTITSTYHIIPKDNRRNPASIRSYGFIWFQA
jgi:hypothetical protein